MHYDKSLPCPEQAERALEEVRERLLHLGFCLKLVGERDFEVAGPGMHSTKEDPLLGISAARVSVGERQLRIHAELGAARRMQAFVLYFPVALVVVLCGVFAFTVPHGEMFAQSSGLVLLLSWLVVGFAMGLWIERRTKRAIDVLLENAVRLAASRG